MCDAQGKLLREQRAVRELVCFRNRAKATGLAHSEEGGAGGRREEGGLCRALWAGLWPGARLSRPQRGGEQLRI